MKIKLIILTVLVIAIFSQNSFTQTWNGILSFNPYPSPYASDWENNPSALGSLTVFNNSGSGNTIIIKAVVSQEGKGEVFRSSINPIDISAAPVTVLNNTKLFNLSDASFTDSRYERTIRLTGRLLEGYYIACLTIEDIDGVVLAANICTNFTILYPEPPHLIFPLDNDSVLAATTYPTFQWTPVIVPPAYQLTYTLKICEIFAGQTPLQALSANYPHYTNNQLTINLLTYPIEALPLEQGKKYVWQVQALDQFGFPPAQNQGKSEIFTFVKQPVGIIFPILILIAPTLELPLNNSTFSVNKPQFSWKYTLSQGENIKYRLKICKMLSGQSPSQAINNTPIYSTIIGSQYTSFTPPLFFNFSNNSSYVWKIDVINANNNSIKSSSEVWKFTYKFDSQIIGEVKYPAWCSLSGKLHYKYAYQHDTQNWPLANKTVKLVVKYIMDVKSSSSNVKSGGASVEDPKGQIILGHLDALNFGNDPDKILDVKVTDINGNFKFSFINPDSMKIIKENGEISQGSSIYYGDIYRVARLIVDDKYYLSPDDDIYIQPYETKNIGTLVSAIRSYSLEVTMKPSQDSMKKPIQYTNQDLAQMDVYLMRKKHPTGLPLNEGDPKPTKPEKRFGFEVIAKATTTDVGSMPGKIIFNRLIINILPTDRYYLYAESSVNAAHNYVLPLQAFSFSYGNKETDKYDYTRPNVADPSNIVFKKYTGGGGGIHSVSVKDEAVFNSQYIYPIVHLNSVTIPLLPMIKGRIVREDDHGIPIGGAKVKLFKKITSTSWTGHTTNSWVVEGEKTVSASGYFSFSNLSLEQSNQHPYPLTGPLRKLLATAQGFQSSGFKVISGKKGGVLALGEKYQMGDIGLNPGAIVTGKISDDKGNGIWAKIKIGDSPEKTVKPESFYNPKTKQFVISPGGFQIPVAKLDKQPIIITPDYNASSYILDTLYRNITQTNQDLGTLKVFRKLHRIKFIVKEAQPWTPTLKQLTPPVNQWPVLSGAKVKIELLASWIQKTATQSGEVSFEYQSDSDSFKVVLEAPTGKYYVKQVLAVKNKPSKYEQTYVVALEKATFISGNVYINIGTNKPVANADVWIDMGNPELNISVKTNNSGAYFLSNVPINSYKIVYASKSAVDTTIIGDSALVYTGRLGLGRTGIDLHLTIYNGMDITKLLGFPIQLTALEEATNGEVKISGILKQFKKNDYFSVYDSTSAKLKLANIFVKPGTKINSNGVPYAVLVESFATADDPYFDLKLFQKFKCTVSNPSEGIKIFDSGNDNGVINGTAFVSASQFNTSGSIENYSGIYLSDPSAAQNKILIPTITAEGNKPLQIPKGFNVTDANGSGLLFKINKFDASAEPQNSFFNFDTVRLRTTLKTNIKNAVPSNLNLQIGDVVFHQVGIDPIVSDKQFTFKLDNWNLFAKKWIFNQGNIKITEGTLKTGADIPIISLDITPTTFTSADFDFKSMLVSGIVPINISGKSIFGYDQTTNWWYVSVNKKTQSDQYSASFQNLPGMEPGALIKLNSFVMNSKNSFFMLNPVQQTIKLYKVGIVNLNTAALLAYNNYLEMPGLTFNIPKVTQSTSFQYSKGNNGKIAFKMKGININADAGNGVYIQFGVDETQANSQVLDENGFRSRGVVGEFGKFELVNWLFHSASKTEIVVETPQTPFSYSQNFQRLNIGSNGATYFNKMTGGMTPQNASSWNSYHFEGFIEGTKSVGFKDNQNKLSFIVKGEIVANNQTLGIKNVDTPFGNMQWFYEFENSRLRGSVNVNTNIQNQIFLNGTAETIVDADGWYFFGGLNMGMATPHLQGTAGILFGNYPMTPEIKTTFSKYSGFYKQAKKLPPNFPTTVSGFFVEGEVEIPVPIFPDFDFDFGLVSAHLKKYIGCDFRLGMQFSEVNKYSVGADIFAKIEAGVGGTVGVACAMLSASACAGIGLNGQYSSNGNWYAQGSGGVTLSGKTTVGWGLCDSKCNGIENPFGDGDTCSSSSEDASIGIGIEGRYGTQGKWIHIQWGAGGPSICN